MRVWSTALVVVVLAASSAMAWDYDPPSWRGEPLTVYAEWNFDASGTAPNAFTYVGGNGVLSTVQPTLTLTGGTATWAGGAWQIDTTATFELTLPNWIDEEAYKLMHVQWHFSGNTTPVVNAVIAYDGVTSWLVGYNPGEGVERTIVDDGQIVDDVVIVPNPDYEVINFTMLGTGVLEQVVVDTISLPEPASLVLLTLGAIAMARRRR